MPGLEDLYREIILDHYRSPRNRGELESPPAQRVEGFNPLCGDEVVVDPRRRATACVTDIKIAGTGCSISQSSASLMSAAVKGKPVAGGPGPDPHLQGDDVHPRVDTAVARRRGRRPGGASSRSSPRPSTSTPSASWPPSRAWSSFRCASSAPRSAGTRWPRVSTRRRTPDGLTPADRRHRVAAAARRASAGRGVEVGLDGGRRARRGATSLVVEPPAPVDGPSWWSWSVGTTRQGPGGGVARCPAARRGTG